MPEQKWTNQDIAALFYRIADILDIQGEPGATPAEAKNLRFKVIAYRRGEAWSRTIIDETVNYLSIAIINISTLLDPELIILGGGVSESADVLLPCVQARIQGVLPKTPTLKVSTLGRRAAVMGAIAQIVHLTSDYYVARKIA